MSLITYGDTMKLPINVGDEIQVYNKGEAYTGCLNAFGKVKDMDQDCEEYMCYEIEGVDGWWDDGNYDIVLVSTKDPFFAEQKKRLDEVNKIENKSW